MKSLLSLAGIVLEGKASKRFLFGAIGSFSFSIAVILCTVGLMDGFEQTLKTSLKKSAGDFEILSNDSFFFTSDLSELKKDITLTPLLQIEAFVVHNDVNKGVLVKGIEPVSFAEVTDLGVETGLKGVVIGSELQEALDVSIGDEITFAFASNQKRDQGSAILKKLPVEGIIHHGIYEKDLRFVYIDRKILVNTLGYREETINKALVKNDKALNPDQFQTFLEGKLADNMFMQPYWAEYKTLLSAVEVEKNSISLVLQLIVIVAIFNVLAFIIFISEKKSQEFFLLRAFGISMKQLSRFWMCLLISIWLVSSLFSIFLSKVFNYILINLPIFQLPGDIYVLSKLEIILSLEDYFWVFSAALVWILLIGFFAILRIKKHTVLSGLRQEFR